MSGANCCSAPNSVSGISRLVEKLAKSYGEPLGTAGEGAHTFPSPSALSKVDEFELRREGFGLHSARVAQDVANGDLDLEQLRVMPYQEAKMRLMAYKGIKDKVANCVLLFSLDKNEAFPVDRNIGRALVKFSFNYLSETELKTLEKRGHEHFGQCAGYAGRSCFMKSGLILIHRRNIP